MAAAPAVAPASKLLATCTGPITECLDLEDVVRMGAVCKAWHRVIARPNLWQNLCTEVWGLLPGEVGDNPHATFKQYAGKYWRFRSCFGGVRRLWRRFETWMAAHSPHMLKSLNPGATDAELKTVADEIGMELPLEVQCFYAIHNGQTLVVPDEARSLPLHNLDGVQEEEWKRETGFDHHPACLGMFGGWSAYDQHTSLYFLSLNFVVRMIRRDEERDIHYIPIAFDRTSSVGSPQNSLFLFLQSKDFANDRSARPAWSVCYNGSPGRCPHAAMRGGGMTNYFLAGASLLGHVHALVTRLEQGIYRTRLGEIQLFPCGNNLGATVTVTNGVTIEASPLLIPHASNPHQLLFAYRLTIRATGSGKAQMNYRTWNSRNSPDEPFEQVVRGAAVVGYHPEVGPGMPAWEYASMTKTESTLWGEMGGSLSFVPGSLAQPTGPEFEAGIDPMTLTFNEQAVMDATQWPPRAAAAATPASPQKHADPMAM